MAIVNIGILAHVDAGKTSLTERILFETGVIASVGRVDKGTTQTDTLELERSRGITIKSAVVSFQINELKVNLIDTPGHADFIAEVERSLRVLDAVVLVISAVEGVQPQTRLIARAIRSAELPMIIFVNKIDRMGARGDLLLEEIRRKLDLRIVAMNGAVGLGERTAEVVPLGHADPIWRTRVIDVLADAGDRMIEEFDRTDGEPGGAFLESELRAQIARREVVPVFFGSAITGAGVPELIAGIEEWLPAAGHCQESPLSGVVFKIARRSSGEKIVYARLFAGSAAVRQPVAIVGQDGLGERELTEERLTGIDRFALGTSSSVDVIGSGEIASFHGLRSARIGDWIGDSEVGIRPLVVAFPAPTLESIVRPVEAEQITQLRAALEELAEQDPLISLRQRDEAGEISVRLFGEVQKEVIQETLAQDYRIRASFGPSRIICIERPVRAGEHIESMSENGNPFYATVGLRIEPAEAGSGVSYYRELGSLPLAFYRAIEETVFETLAQGLCGWEVTDCAITLINVAFNSVMSTAGDFRNLTPLVLMQALSRAGTGVCEPFAGLELEIPEETVGPVTSALVRARAVVRSTFLDGNAYHLACEIPIAELRSLERQLPGLTHGDGSWVSHPSGYVPVTGTAPMRERVGPDPLNRAHYLALVARR